MGVSCLLLLSAFIVLAKGQGYIEDGIKLPTVLIPQVQLKQNLTTQIRGIHRNVTWAIVPLQIQSIVPFKKQSIGSDILIILEVTDTDGDITVYTSENEVCDPRSATGYSNTKYVHALYKSSTNVLYFCIHKQEPQPLNLNQDQFVFHYDAAQEVEYGDRVEVTCGQQQSNQTEYNVIYMLTKMPSPKSSPSVEVVLNNWFDNLFVHVSVNVPPVGEDYELSGSGEPDIDFDTNTYDIEIDRELNTDDVVYTRIKCEVVTSISKEFLSYTYSMGAIPFIPMVMGAVFGSVFGALILMITIGGVVAKPFKKEVENNDMLRLRYFPKIAVIFFAAGAVPTIIVGILLFNLTNIIAGASLIGAGVLALIIGLIFTGPSVFTLNKTTDEFIVTKHWLLTLPSRSVHKLSDIESFQFSTIITKRGTSTHAMQVRFKEHKFVDLEMGHSNSYYKTRDNMLKRFNNFMGNVRAEAVNKKRNMLREMDPNALADYMVKHPEDSHFVAQVLKEQTSPPPEVIQSEIQTQKLNMLREMETGDIADYLAKHPEDNTLVAQVLKEKANTPYY